MAAERALENSSGCARTEGMKAVTQSGGSGRITRALVRNAEGYNSSSGDALAGVGSGGKKFDSEKAKADRSLNQRKYRKMKSIPMGQRLEAKRSHIHGWGLFSKVDVPKDGMIVEYMGETIRQCIADQREKKYEISGEGSCYMVSTIQSGNTNYITILFVCFLPHTLLFLCKHMHSSDWTCSA